MVKSAKTANSFRSAVNALALTVNRTSVTAPIINNNILIASGALMVSTINGVTSNAFYLNTAAGKVLKSAL